MPGRVVIIQGHPDPSGGHLCHALADAYADGACASGRDVCRIEIAKLSVPFLRGHDDVDRSVTEDIASAQRALAGCAHIVVVFPIWNGGSPALVRAFFEQTFRSSFVFPASKPGDKLGFFSIFSQHKALTGKSARVVTTMQMPASWYRWYFRPHLEVNTLRVAGARVRESLLGRVDSSHLRRARWIDEMRELGRAAR